jgi:hypothetical protein
MASFSSVVDNLLMSSDRSSFIDQSVRRSGYVRWISAESHGAWTSNAHSHVARDLAEALNRRTPSSCVKDRKRSQA